MLQITLTRMELIVQLASESQFCVNVLLLSFNVCFFFFKILSSKNSSRNIISESNSLDPDQAQRMSSPDLGPKQFEKVTSASNTGW